MVDDQIILLIFILFTTDLESRPSHGFISKKKLAECSIVHDIRVQHVLAD